MRVIDLTHLISPDMPVYPGTEGPKFSPANTYERDGFQETLLSMYSHTGTHMGPPAHLFAGRTTLDQMPAARFVGTACVVDCTGCRVGERITMDLVQRQPHAQEAEFLLFHTGWDRYWGQEQYFGAYPYLDEAVVDFVLQKHKKGVGLDTIGLDPVADVNLTLHKRLLRDQDVVIIENLTNLGQLGERLFIFCALPLKYCGADGAPVRAVGLLENGSQGHR